ncbi:hypothetical protein B0H14DRAFT_1339746 [Mycena olivaceomarginata]|nr:hypothetical protein B0H14DRAFT_1339746 [Mycena olivaceomarginata]
MLSSSSRAPCSSSPPLTRTHHRPADAGRDRERAPVHLLLTIIALVFLWVVSVLSFTPRIWIYAHAHVYALDGDTSKTEVETEEGDGETTELSSCYCSKQPSTRVFERFVHSGSSVPMKRERRGMSYSYRRLCRCSKQTASKRRLSKRGHASNFAVTVRGFRRDSTRAGGGSNSTTTTSTPVGSVARSEAYLVSPHPAVPLADLDLSPNCSCFPSSYYAEIRLVLHSPSSSLIRRFSKSRGGILAEHVHVRLHQHHHHCVAPSTHHILHRMTMVITQALLFLSSLPATGPARPRSRCACLGLSGSRNAHAHVRESDAYSGYLCSPAAQ